MAIDWSILHWLQGLHSGVGNALLPFISRLGNGGMIWIIVAVGLLIHPRTRKAGLAVGLALLLEVILCNGLLKPLIARVRPFDIQTGVELLIAKPTDFSFPSGHTASSFAAASALLCQKSRLRLPALLLASLIAFSRLYLFVHFPSDVLGGILLGLGSGAAGSWAADRIARRFQ